MKSLGLAAALAASALALDIQPDTLAAGEVGMSYQQVFTPIGFPSGPVTLSIVSGTLPPGISLQTYPGGLFALLGSCTTAGSYSFTVGATDGALNSVTRAYTMIVSPSVPHLHVSNGTLPAATLGQPYSFTITTIDGTPPLTVTITSGSLTPGLTLNPSGLISGTPTALGSYSFNINIVDSVGTTGTWAYQLNTYPPPLTVSPATIPSGTVGQNYSVSFSASGGSPPYSYNLSLAFIPGMALDSQSGLFTGTPSLSGSYTIRVDATDSHSASGSRVYTLNIAGNNTILLTPPTLPNGTVGQAYSQTVFAAAPVGSNLALPVHWAVSNGTLPPGLSLNSSVSDRVTIQGMPTTAGTYPFHLTGTDSGGATSGWDYSITIGSPVISVSPASLQTGTVSVLYAVNFTASGGTPPYTFVLFNESSSIGVSPLSLSPNGSFQYTSVVAGYANFQIQATDSIGAKGARDYQLTIAAATLSVTPAQLPSGAVHQNYSVTLGASGGTAPYTFSLSGGTLPSGLSLSQSGSLSGVPQTAGVFNVSITASDSNSAVASRSYQLNIAGDAITLGPTSLPDALGNQAYFAQITASGGTAPYAFTMPSATNWAAGMVVNPDGTITGSPPGGTTIVLSFTVVATDANGSSGSRIFQINLRSGQATLTFAPASLPSARVATAYTATITASGGQAPYTFSNAGSLPAGLALSASGVLAGTPSISGSYAVHIQASDANGLLGTVNYVLDVTGSPSGNSLIVSPGKLAFSSRKDDSIAPAPQSISVFSAGGPVNFTVTSSGGSWLTASPGTGQAPGSVMVSVSKSGLASGTTYNGQITVTGQNTTPSAATIPVTLAISPDSPPVLGVAPSQMQLSYVQGSGPDHQQLAVSNLGSGTLSFGFQVETNSCGAWLTPANGNASATPGVPSVINFTVDPQGLPVGTCAGQITVTGDSVQNQTIPVTMVISGQSQSLLLSQTGLDFQVAPGSPQTTQTFGILNAGTGGMSWSIPSSGTGWLKISPANGVAAAGAAASLVSVTVDPQGLPSGQYYGTVEIDAPGAGNSPKSVTVSMSMLDTGKYPAPAATPSGLILVGQLGPATTNAQSVTLANHSNTALTYTSTVATEDGQPWLTRTAAAGSVPPNGTAQMNVQANLAGLSAGLGRGTIRVAFADGTVATVGVVLVVSSPSGATNADLPSAAQATPISGCSVNADLALVFQSPGDSFDVLARRPVPLQVQASDCQGNAITNSAASYVIVRIPNSPDIEIPLRHQGSGLWTATWTPAMGASGVSLLARASKSLSSMNALFGKAILSGTVKEAPAAEAAGAVISLVNGASNDRTGEITAGAWVTVKGTGLADASMVADTVPYPKTLSGTQVLIQNQRLPLYYVSATQINALIPAGLNADKQQLIVIRNGRRSAGVDVLVSHLEPGLFSLDGSGQGQGAILIANTGFVAGPTSTPRPAQPVQHGQYISIYCTGLGPVNASPPPDGDATPLSPFLTTIASPKVKIGGMDAPVSFSGLAPTLVGVYLVNVQVPDSVSPGDDVPVTLTIGNIASNTVTISVR